MAEAHAYQTPTFAPRKQLPDLGTEILSAERYYCPDFMQREWTHIWTKVWHMAIRESEIPEVGDFAVHELGKESFIFVRGQDEVVRGFYNVCQHRGNRLCQSEQGFSNFFQCPYHGWQWNIDGSLRQVADPQFFRQFNNGVPTEELGLTPVQIELWGGWVWFNMNLDARPLDDYLGEIVPHLEPYELEKWDLVDYRTLEFECNWKHAVDASNESYHFLALHPQSAGWAEGWDTPNEILGIHNRMLQMIGTVSARGPSPDELSPELKTMMRNWLQIDPDEYTGRAKDVYLEVRRRKRAAQDSSHLPYQKMSEEQLSDLYHYTVFPNFILNIQPESGTFFRIRPHASDPGRCYFDLLLHAHLPPEEPRPSIEHHFFRVKTMEEFAASFQGTLDPSAVEIQAQDAANLKPIQQGCQSDSFKGGILGDQEIGVRHFHQVLDSFLTGERDA